MNKLSLQCFIVTATLLTSPYVFAADGSWNTDASGNWSVAGNWTPSFPDGAGSTANLTFDITGNRQVTIDTTSRTVGILNIGDPNGTNNYTLNASGGATLTMDNGGSGAQINDSATGAGDQVNLPLVLADNLTINAASITSGFQVNGSVTGTGNVTFNNTGGQQTTVSANINNVGELITSSTSGTTRFQGGVGSNVTQIINSGTAQMMFASTGISVNSNGTTLTNSSTGTINADGGVGAIGTGNFTFNNDGSGSALIGGANNIGELILDGTFNNSGNDTQTQVGVIGSNVTEILQESAVTAVGLRNGSFTVNAAGSTLVNTGGASLALKQNVTGTGDLILQNDTSVSGAILVAEQVINNTGSVINSGNGTGEVSITTGLGANVVSVVQNSANSASEFRNAGSSFTGAWKIEAGTLIYSGGNSDFQSAAQVIVGDTAAHGAGSTLKLNVDGGTWTTGATQTVSGFGNISSQNMATSSGTTLAPGSLGNIGTLTVNNSLTLAGGTNLTFDLGTATPAPATSLSSILAVGGALNLPALKLNLNLLNNAGDNGQGSLGAGTYELVSYNSLTGASAGDITSLFNITGPAGFAYSVSNTGTSAGQIDLTVIAVPEPGSYALALSGFLLLLSVQRFRSRRA